MHGDFTRLNFQPKKRFNRVLMQQGRVQLDQDWNEQMAILARRWELQTADMIGQSGAPQKASGLKVSYDPASQSLSITPGRLYVSGLLVEAFPRGGEPYPASTAPFQLSEQPFLMHNPVQAPPEAENRTDLLYLRAWERHVSAVEDPGLLEPALGGADTATRTQTAWQVLAMGAPADAKPGVPFEAWSTLTAAKTGRLSSRSRPAAVTGDDGFLPDGGGYRGLENRLYRVEIHTGGTEATARFKWSRDNGSVAVAIERIDGRWVTVTSLGRDPLTRFTIGQWIEVLDDQHEFAEGHGQLVQIRSIREADRQLELSEPVIAYGGANPRIRRWDQVSTGALAMTDDWIELELGVQIKFEPGTYQTGDYWTFTARAATATVETLETAAPQGTEYRYYPLALLTWAWVEGASPEAPKQLTCLVTDWRYEFPALTEQAPPEVALPSVHVTAGAEFGRRLQQAIQNVTNGGLITLDPGNHRLERPILIEERRGITIKGVPGATRLLFESADPSAPALTIKKAQEIHIEGLSLYGRQLETLVLIPNSQVISFSDCRLGLFESDGAAIWCPGTLNLRLEGCAVAGPAAIASPEGIGYLQIHHSVLRAHRVGILSRFLTHLLLSDSMITDIPGLTADAVVEFTPAALTEIESWLHTGNYGIQQLNLPVGVLAAEADHWHCTGSLVGAAVALGALQVDGLTIHECELKAVVGLLSIESANVKIRDSAFPHAMGQSVCVYGTAQNWQITGSTLTGWPEAVSFGLRWGDTYLWLTNLLAALDGGSTYLLSGVEDVASGISAAELATLSTSTWLLNWFHEIFDPVRLTDRPAHQLNQKRFERIQVQGNHLSGISFHEDCLTAQIQISDNLMASAQELPFVGVRLHGQALEGGGASITGNEIATSGNAISLKRPGVTVSQNRILLSGRPAERLDVFAVATKLQSQGAYFRDMGEALAARQGSEFRFWGREAIAAQDRFPAVFAAVTNTYTTPSLAQHLAEILRDAVPGDPRTAHILALWVDLTAQLLENASIRLTGSDTTLLDNRIQGQADAVGSILITRAMDVYDSYQVVIRRVKIRGNQLLSITGYSIIGDTLLEGIRIEENELTDVGGIYLRRTVDILLRANQISLPFTQPSGWPPLYSGLQHAAILLEEPKGRLEIMENRVWSSGWRALHVGSSTELHLFTLTSNNLQGAYRDPAINSLLYLAGDRASVVFAQNQIAYTSTEPTTTAVVLWGARAAITSNIWLWTDDAQPIQVNVPVYTMVGNIANKRIVDVETPQKQADLNAIPSLEYADDPQILISPALPLTVTAAIQIKGTVRDRNAEADQGNGIATFTIKVDGSATYQLTGITHNADGTFVANWDPALQNLPYGDHKIQLVATSAITGKERTLEIPVAVAPTYPNQPTLTISSPASGSSFMPGDITLTGTHQDLNASGANKGVKKIEFYDGEAGKGGIRLGEVVPTSGSWSFVWKAGTVGVHTLYLYAYSMRGGTPTKWTHPLTITPAYPSDPISAITEPSSGSSTTGRVFVQGTAEDRNRTTGTYGKGVSKVRLLDITTSTTKQLAEVSVGYTGAWGATWNVTGLPPGTYTLVPEAYSTVQSVWKRGTPKTHEIDYRQIMAASYYDAGLDLGGPQHVFEGYAVDYRVTYYSGISLVDAYLHEAGYPAVHVGTAEIGLTTLYLTGPRAQDSGWRFSFNPYNYLHASSTGGTESIVAGGGTTYPSSYVMEFRARSGIDGTTISDTIVAYTSTSGPDSSSI